MSNVRIINNEKLDKATLSNISSGYAFSLNGAFFMRVDLDGILSGSSNAFICRLSTGIVTSVPLSTVINIVNDCEINYS